MDSDVEILELSLGPEFDLHTFRPAEVASAVEEYLEVAHQRGWQEVRIIHGRGIGVQRDLVRRILARTVFVESFADDINGNRGATLARLRPPAPSVPTC